MQPFSIPAIIDKSQIAEFGEMRGRINSTPVVLAGKSFDARRLAYIGFAGGCKGDGRYHGVHRFGVSVAAIPGDHLVASPFTCFAGKVKTPKTARATQPAKEER